MRKFRVKFEESGHILSWSLCGIGVGPLAINRQDPMIRMEQNEEIVVSAQDTYDYITVELLLDDHNRKIFAFQPVSE